MGYRLAIVCCALLLLSACGLKGELKRPSEIEQKQENTI